MNFLKKHKNKIISVSLIALLLTVVYFADSKNDKPRNIDETSVAQVKSSEMEDEPIKSNSPVNEETANAEQQKQKNDEPEKISVANQETTCTISVKCDTILSNIENLVPEKAELVPENGVILPETAVSFTEGDNVFDVLKRVMTDKGIHLEFVHTPIYNSAYIEGIANFYEFDCGELSGWMYKVNGYYPNYGCSQYKLKNGDKIEWVYTCDLGADVGGEYSARNGM